MKKYLTSSMLIILFITFSCEDAKVSNVIGPVPSSFTKKVLIEEFTGHRCTNCPAAAKEISAIQNIYGDQVIAIAIHPSGGFMFTQPDPFSQTGFQYDW